MEMDLQGVRVVVMGLGRSGQAAARLAQAHGAEVLGVDLSDGPALDGIPTFRGPHRVEDFQSAQLVIVSPGIPVANPFAELAKAHGAEVIGELGFASRYLDRPYVAVTGTNGKSTVTTWAAQLAGAFAGGNLGTPASEWALAEFPATGVIEVSSYQMEAPGPFQPVAAVVLNLTPDHLKRHKTMAAYGAAKMRVFARMRPGQLGLVAEHPDLVWSSPATRLDLGQSSGVAVEQGIAVVHTPAEERYDLAELQVPGHHNQLNAAVAIWLARCLRTPPEVIRERLPVLRALAHRMEPVGDDGRLWVNDSKATNLDASRVAIEGIGRPAVVLLGGEPKGPGFGTLADGLRGQRAVLAFGEAAAQIERELAAEGVAVQTFASMEDAAGAADRLAQPGDAVLLTPACASFDAFDNFVARGDAFRAWVEAHIG